MDAHNRRVLSSDVNMRLCPASSRPYVTFRQALSHIHSSVHHFPNNISNSEYLTP